MSVVLISGGTGLIGTKLTGHLTGSGYDVILLSRNQKINFWKSKNNIQFLGYKKTGN